jgi:hypothetical protein
MWRVQSGISSILCNRTIKKPVKIIHGLELTMQMQELLFDDALFGIGHATNLHIDPI